MTKKICLQAGVKKELLKSAEKMYAKVSQNYGTLA